MILNISPNKTILVGLASLQAFFGIREGLWPTEPLNNKIRTHIIYKVKIKNYIYLIYFKYIQHKGFGMLIIQRALRPEKKSR